MTNRKGRSAPGGHHQVFFAFKQEAQCKSTFQPCQNLRRCLPWGQAGRQSLLGQHHDGFGVGLGFRNDALLRKFGAQGAEIFDDAVMHDSDPAPAVRMCVFHGRRAVGGPARVPDARASFERRMHQKILKVDQFANGPTAIQHAVIDGCDAGTVIAAILQTLQRFDKDRSDFVIPKDTNNTTHT